MPFRHSAAPFCLVLLFAFSWPLGAETAQLIRTALQAELENFSLPGWNRKPEVLPSGGGSLFVPALGPALTRYRQQLVKVGGWTGGPIWHQAGTIPFSSAGTPKETLGINVFLPPGKPKGTLLFVHGYLAHAADFAYTFAFFTARDWAVVTLDLPGHGLSSGPRGDVGTFSEYGDAVQTWLDWISRQKFPGPHVLLAHSLGTAACLDALVRPGTPLPDQAIFCAPLLRPVWYPVLVAGETVLGWAFREFPSQLGSDGYLDGTATPTHWFSALRLWLEAWKNRQPFTLPLTIYSGDRDQIVDQAWNQADYRRIVPGHRYVTLPGEDHFFLTSGTEREAFHLRLASDLGL